MKKSAWKIIVGAIGLSLLFSAAAIPSANSSAATKPIKKIPAVYGFKANTLTDTKFNGAELAGKPTVLWFWAPWCTICRGEAPDLVALANDFKGKVKVVGVAGLAPVEDMKQFVTDTKSSNFVHLADSDGAIWLHFKIPAQPSFIFLNSKGAVTRQIGALSKADLYKMTRKLIKKS